MQVGTARAAAGLHGDPLAHRGDPPRQHEGVDAGQLAVGYRAIEALGELARSAQGRYGHTSDVAAIVSFLAGPESGYVTGANWNVDGGFTV